MEIIIKPCSQFYFFWLVAFVSLCLSVNLFAVPYNIKV